MNMNSKKGAGFQALFLVSLILAAMSFIAPRSTHAQTLPDVQLRVLNAIGDAARSNSADSGEGALNLQYFGSKSESIVTITATAMSFFAAASVPDTTIGTAGVVTFASTPGCSTLGGLCDYINGLRAAGTGKYVCKLTGGKRDDLPILLADQTAATGVKNMGAAGGASFQFEGPSTLGTGSAFIVRQGFTPPTDKRVLLRKCVVKGAGTGTLLVYGKRRRYEGVNDGVTRNDSTQVWSEPTADATALTEDWSLNGANGGGIEFGKNEHVVVSVGNVATQQIAADFVSCAVEYR
jgi:hypothetical protein